VIGLFDQAVMIQPIYLLLLRKSNSEIVWLSFTMLYIKVHSSSYIEVVQAIPGEPNPVTGAEVEEFLENSKLNAN